MLKYLKNQKEKGEDLEKIQFQKKIQINQKEEEEDLEKIRFQRIRKK